MAVFIINIKYIMLVLFVIQMVVVHVNCGFSNTVLNTSEALWKQFEALEHVHSFLKEVQIEIKESRQLLKSVPFEGWFRQSAQSPARTAPKWIMQKDLLRYLSPTVSEGILRTVSTTVADNPASPNGTTRFNRSSPPRRPMDSFLEARDYVLPDFGPEYRDIFAPDMERQGDANKENMAAVTMGIDMLFVTVPSPGDVLLGEVLYHTTTADPHPTLHSLLVKDSSGYISVGFEMLCMLVAEKDPGTVKAVLEQSEKVIARLEHERRDRFEWMHEPMRTVLNNQVALMSPSQLQIDELQTKARLMMETMKNRRETLSDYVNRILDFADGLVKQEDGEEIFDVLDAFREFPKRDKKGHKRTAEKMCEDLIMAFSHPFYFETLDRRRLINAANRAIRERFAYLNIFRRQATRKKQYEHYRPRTSSRYEFKQAWHTPRNSRIPIYGHKFSIAQRNSAIYKRDLRRSIYNYKNIIKHPKNTNYDKVKSLKQSEHNNNLKYGKTYTQGTIRKFQENININRTTTNKVINTRNSLHRDKVDNAKVTEVLGDQKTTRVQSILIATSQRRKLPIHTKQHIDTRTKRYKDPSYKNHDEAIELRSYTKHQNKLATGSKNTNQNQNNSVTKLKTTKSIILNKNQIKKASKIAIKDNKNENFEVYLNESDEKLILDVKLLNRVLNVTSEDSLTDLSLVDESGTDDDEDVLKNLYDAFYN